MLLYIIIAIVVIYIIMNYKRKEGFHDWYNYPAYPYHRSTYYDYYYPYYSNCMDSVFGGLRCFRPTYVFPWFSLY